MRRIIILIIMFIIILVLLVVIYFAVGNYFFDIALSTNTSKTFVIGEEAERTEEEQKMLDRNLNWLEEKSDDVYIMSLEDNLRLHAYEIINENTSDVWVIAIHGYISEGKQMIYPAKEFYNMGYNVLVVDLRGHGKSEGEYVGMGWQDRLDVIQWINYIIGKNKDSKIILYGISMGASTVMMTTGEELPVNVRLAIEDCGYTSAWDELEIKLEELFNLPSFPVLNAANTVCNIRANYDLKEASCIKQVEKSITPTLFIHGSEDNFVPFKMLDKLYESANCEKEKLIVEGAGHAEASSVNPKLYWSTVYKFMQRYL